MEAKRHPRPGLEAGLVVGLWLAILFSGCGPDSTGRMFAVNGDPQGAFYSSAVTLRHDSTASAQLWQGEAIFRRYCAICHGETGDGNGFNAYNLTSTFGVQPFNFTDTTAVASLSIEEVKRAIAEGGPAVGKSPYMPPWGKTMSEYDLACLTAYVWGNLMHKTSN